MSHAATSAGRAVGGLLGGDREIGPIGTVARVAAGLLAIILPIALEGISWWDVGAALVAFPLIATGIALLAGASSQRVSSGALGRAEAACCSGPSCAILAILVAIPVGLTFVTPVTGVAVWVWIGASLLLAAARGQGGCELLAFPNAITGRRDRIGCIVFTPIDAAEARRAR
jgi:cobalamin synthase